MGRKNKLLLVLVAVLVVFAGCASGTGGGDGSAGGADGGGDGGDGGGGAPKADGDGGGQASSSQGSQSAITARPRQTSRSIIRTGRIELEVNDFESARSRIANHARSLGGYVGGSGSTLNTRDNESWKTGYVVVRVPSEKFSEMLSFARKQGTVLSEKTTTKDVTDRLVNLKARLTNLEKRRARLRSFYDQADSTEELIRIERRLSKVQGQIEKLKAKKRSLEDRVAYATLRVKLSEPSPTGTLADRKSASGASLVTAFANSAQTLLDLSYGFVLFSVRIAPYVVVLGVPALLVTVAVRRRYEFGIPFVEKPPSSSSSGGPGTARSPDSEDRTEQPQAHPRGGEETGEDGADVADVEEEAPEEQEESTNEAVPDDEGEDIANEDVDTRSRGAESDERNSGTDDAETGGNSRPDG